MTNPFRGLMSKQKHLRPATVDLTLNLISDDPDTHVDIAVDMNGEILCTSRTGVATSHHVHCDFDDSQASANGWLQIQVASSTTNNWSLVIQALTVQDIDITHLLPCTHLYNSGAVRIAMDKPIWSWLVKNWTKILPQAAELYKQLNNNQ